MILRFSILVMFLCCCVNSYAEKSGVFANLNVSHAAIDLNYSSKQFEPFERWNNKQESAAFGVGIGYQFNSRVVIDFNYASLDTINFYNAVDSYRLIHKDVSLGYKFGWKNLYLMPQIGYADWRLSAKEGKFLNPGPEETKIIFDSDYVWGFSIGFDKPNLALFLSHKIVDTNFGGYDLSSIGFNIFL
ncbi:MAG: outer membrane beta-barrel protein [Porticoccaceae bacterium]|nr:outer membrane beta-barrel protein [Porticoccaceae bacterium]